MVPTAFGPCVFAMRSIASTISDNVASASRRSGIGVVPAWLSKPVILPSYQSDALAAIDHADGLVLGFEQRALLDVQFDEARRTSGAPTGALAAIADAVERFADADAVGILARQNIVGGEVADIGGRRHRRRRKARAFLVGPVADADRRLGLDAGIVQGAHHFERGERAEHAVILAAGRLGVEMRAEADRRLRHVASLAQAEHRAERVDMDFEAGRLAGPAEPVAHLLVLGPERQPPHAAFRRGAEFRGLVNRVPQPGRSRFADWKRSWSSGHSGHSATIHAPCFNDAATAARQQRRRPAPARPPVPPRVRPQPCRETPASSPKTSTAGSAG